MSPAVKPTKVSRASEAGKVAKARRVSRATLKGKTMKPKGGGKPS